MNIQKIAFASIRMGTLTICNMFACWSIAFIISKKLYRCIPILFILFAQIFTLIMISNSLIYLIYSIVYKSEIKPQQFICYGQAYIFRVTQLATLNFTALLIFFIYKGIKQESSNLVIKIKKYFVGCLLVPIAIMLPPVFSKTYIPCMNYGYSYNCLCTTNNEYTKNLLFFIFFYILPYLLVSIFMMIYSLKIRNYIKIITFNPSEQKQISLILAKYPIWNILLIAINIVASCISQLGIEYIDNNQNHILEGALFFTNLTVFLLPIPNYYAVYKTYRAFKKYQYSYRISPSTGSSKEQLSSNSIDHKLQQKYRYLE